MSSRLLTWLLVGGLAVCLGYLVVRYRRACLAWFRRCGRFIAMVATLTVIGVLIELNLRPVPWYAPVNTPLGHDALCGNSGTTHGFPLAYSRHSLAMCDEEIDVPAGSTTVMAVGVVADGALVLAGGAVALMIGFRWRRRA